MSFYDGIIVASLVSLVSYWITASVKLFFNTRRAKTAPHPGPLPRGARGKKDPESVEIWRRLEAAEITACCKAVRRARDEWDIAWLDVSFERRTVQRVQLNYCPGCGRKL
jgi:hypothetical protein